MNASTIYSFERYEKKYLLTQAQFESVRRSMAEYMNDDDYGLHTISNIYYDTPDYQLIRASIEKPVYKEKLRLRSYGIPQEESLVFVEIKKKFQGVVYKRRACMSLKEAEAYLNDGARPEKQSQILDEIDYFTGRYDLRPAVFIGYDRIATYGKEDPDVRVTYDRDIRYRLDGLSLLQGDAGAPVLPEEWILMEVKISGAAPLWLSRILSENHAYPASFSKYGACYTQNILEAFAVKEAVFCA